MSASERELTPNTRWGEYGGPIKVTSSATPGHNHGENHEHKKTYEVITIARKAA